MAEAEAAATVTLIDSVASRPPRARNWTEEEDAIILANYPGGGDDACRRLLSGRTRYAIMNRRKVLGIRLNPGVKGKLAEKYTTNEHIDRVIKEGFVSEGGRCIARLVTALGRHDKWIRQRAAQLGCYQARAHWSEPELIILEAKASCRASTIRRFLKQAGYTRSIVAIEQALKRYNIFRENDNPNVYTIWQLTELLGHHRSTVNGWIKRGWLKAKKVEVSGAFDITRKNLYEFIKEHPGEIDLRRVDRVWFMDLLLHPRNVG